MIQRMLGEPPAPGSASEKRQKALAGLILLAALFFCGVTGTMAGGGTPGYNVKAGEYFYRYYSGPYPISGGTQECEYLWKADDCNGADPILFDYCYEASSNGHHIRATLPAILDQLGHWNCLNATITKDNVYLRVDLASPATYHNATQHAGILH